MVSALSDGTTVYLNKKEGFTPEFEEGVSYILQNYTLSNTYGQIYLFIGPGTLKFKTVPQELSEEAQNAARAALCPPSPSVTGVEADIFSRGGYLSLQGQIKEMRGVRMTRTHVPILDLHLVCAEKGFDISLWRDVALTDLYVGDEVVITHLRPCILSNGRGKFHSSAYTTVKIAEGQVQDTEAQIIGVSEINDTCHFLTSDSVVYVIPQYIFHGKVDDLISRLPMRLTLKHINRRVLEIQSVKE
ncbi:putative C-mannosyltransferase DPY19L3 isoform X1 [Labeo rohita]|uniref:Putative C-mannosyltransferase DPY19L3 isoform X1 n=1 Tax=Labeo rohita TaxID=84645 RepID=A0A498M1B6_LABRO|nr:putative C-mannosyltransferase DPY19L3 isoform X1 [Labeo rohita]